VRGNINRIKSMKNSYLSAYWSDYPCVEIVDMNQVIIELEESSQKHKENLETGLLNTKNKKRKLNSKNVIVKTFARSSEGFGIDWSPLLPGVLAAGGNDKKVDIYLPKDENCSDWILNSDNTNNLIGSIKGHKYAIEDIVWSPVQAHVLATCSVDKSIRFWDLRSDKNNPPIIIEKAHDSDVNCISWNHFCDFMVASGGDDNAFKVWDIRYINNGPISNIQWHKGPITAISWDTYEDSQLAVSSEDNKLSIWDFAVEADDNHLFDNNNKEVPHQLIFLHQGQESIKDLKFHPVYKNFIVSTASNGINVYRPAFNDEDDSLVSDEDLDDEMHVDN
jgi:ribosome assembly protein RRB1